MEPEEQMSEAALDAAIDKIPTLESQSLNQLYFIITSLLSQEELTVQKKAYKALKKIFNTKNGKEVLIQNIEHLQGVLSETTMTAPSAVKKDRLRTLVNVVSLLPPADLHMIPELLSETILSTKEVNAKARKMAYDLLIAMGNKMKAGGVVVMSKIADSDPTAANVDASLDEFVFKMVTAGLAATTPHMISATITSLSRLIFEFREILSEQLIHQLLDTMEHFIKHRDREIVKSTLGFVKVVVISLDVKIISQHLPQIIPGILMWSREHNRHFKAKVKHIFERLMRRFGYETVEKHTPESDRKFLVNIRKQKERAKRKKKDINYNNNDKKKKGSHSDEDEKIAEHFFGQKTKKSTFNNSYEDALFGSGSESEDSENEESVDSHQQPAKNKKGFWIKEEEDMPVDFLDKSIADRVIATDPARKKSLTSKSEKSPFKLSGDGRMFINDSDDEEEIGNKSDVAMSDAQNHYLEAQRSKDGFKRGQRNKIKFNNNQWGNDDMEIEGQEPIDAVAARNSSKNTTGPVRTVKRLKKVGMTIGKEYKAKNAGGDVKRKGKPDPYAYVPLSGMYKKNGQKGPKISLISKGRVRKRRT